MVKLIVKSHSENLTSPWALTSDESMESVVEQVGIKISKKSSSEMIELRSKVEVMQRQIDSRDRIIETLEAEYSIEVESFKSHAIILRTELIVVSETVKREKTARLSIESSFVTQDSDINTSIATTTLGVDELISEYANCCAVLRNAELDLVIAMRQVISVLISSFHPPSISPPSSSFFPAFSAFLHPRLLLLPPLLLLLFLPILICTLISINSKAEKAKKEAEEDAKAALEAADVATASALRRAELEEETDGMIEALIDRYCQS
jgi:hypothetical protein